MIKTVNPLLESSAYFMFPVSTDIECNIQMRKSNKASKGRGQGVQLIS